MQIEYSTDKATQLFLQKTWIFKQYDFCLSLSDLANITIKLGAFYGKNY